MDELETTTDSTLGDEIQTYLKLGRTSTKVNQVNDLTVGFVITCM